MFDRLAARASERIDGASIAAFRILFGLAVAKNAWTDLSDGFVRDAYAEPEFHFAYSGFAWVQVRGDAVYALHLALIAAALALAFGAAYRAAAIATCVLSTWIFLLDEAQYLNHAYLICLYAGLMTFVPAHAQLSVDARLRPALRSRTVERLALWVLRAQMGLVYFFAGIAKLNGDWLSGWPMRIWLPEHADAPLIGPLMTQAWLAIAMSWAGAAIDLGAVPLLLWRRSRLWMMGALVMFHALNSVLFDIGIFPILALSATTLFLEPDWPRRFLRWPEPTEQAPARSLRVPLALAGVYFALQLLLPMRHWLYPGTVHWTEEGHRFAWHMLLRHKQAECTFVVRDRVSNTAWEIDPRSMLTVDQYEAMIVRPEMIHQLAREIARRESARIGRHVQVYAHATAALDGRDPQPMIDPHVDLGAEPERPFAPAPWIEPLSD